MPQSKLCDIAVELLHETNAAWLVDDGDKKVWIPKAIDELEKNHDRTYTLTAPEWILKDKGLI